MLFKGREDKEREDKERENIKKEDIKMNVKTTKKGSRQYKRSYYS